MRLRRNRLVSAIVALAAAALVVAPGRCPGQDLSPYVNQHDAPFAQGQFAEAVYRRALALLGKLSGPEDARWTRTT
jgi:hypothetical protein